MRTKEEKARFYEQLAHDYEAQAVLLRCRASVHLENKDDECFWDAMLQKYRAGKYNYIYYSQNAKGGATSGCTQCLQYKDFLSERFFVCIDSDYRPLLSGSRLGDNRYILQTYTYSWENHYCYAQLLQANLNQHSASLGTQFDFTQFLQAYSRAIYEPLLLFLCMERKGLAGFSHKDFNTLTTLQYKEGDLQNNGESMIRRLREKLQSFVMSLKPSTDFDFTEESSYYKRLGLEERNAYLHFRGHNVYNMLLSLGRHLCGNTREMDFERDVMLQGLLFDGYQEITECGNDVKGL